MMRAGCKSERRSKWYMWTLFAGRAHVPGGGRAAAVAAVATVPAAASVPAAIPTAATVPVAASVPASVPPAALTTSLAPS
eukprot:1061967-Pyramimonas_sp.AAC.1